MKQLARVFNRKPLYRKKAAVDWPLPDQLVGLEVEAENIRGIQKWPDEASLGMYWRRVSDGSLQRGNEYILTQPLSGNMLGGAIQSFYSSGQLVRDPAGSTHIHLNMMDEDDTVDGLRNLCILMYLFEELLFVVGDPGRAACGYTNRLITAPERFLRTIFSPELDDKPQLLAHVFSGDGSSRYYGFNMQALGKHGTVEFRYFPTATNAEELINWIKLLMSFKKVALHLGTVAGIERVLSEESSYIAFVNEHFGSWYEQFLSTIPYVQARRTMDTICAMNYGIAQPQDANVNTNKLKKSRLRKFFVKSEKPAEPVPEPVRPANIYAVLRNEPNPDTQEGFDLDAKSIMVYEGAIYVWIRSLGGWVPMDGYSIYTSLNDTRYPPSEVAAYLTYDRVLVDMMYAAVEARRGSITHRQYESLRYTVSDFKDWEQNISTLFVNGVRKKPAVKDGIYRISCKQLSQLWSIPETSSSYEELVAETNSVDDDDDEEEMNDPEAVDDYEEEVDDYEESPPVARQSGTLTWGPPYAAPVPTEGGSF